MNEKKKSIIEAAIKCFAQKGFHGTSIQEIADTLGIAKGSLYFYFKSKEDLFLSVFQYHVDLMLQKFHAIFEDDTLTPRGKLHRQVVQQYELFMESRDFIQMLMKGQFDMNEEIGQLLHNLRDRTLRWYETCITELYGAEVRPYAPDAAAIFAAMTGEYMHPIFFGRCEQDFERLARFLLERLDDVVQGMIAKKQQPILKTDGAPDACLDIRAMREILEPLELATEQRDEMLSALQVLEEELAKIAPRPVVIKGMLAYLRDLQIAELQPQLDQIAALYE